MTGHDRDTNNFDLVRFVLAAIVFLFHAGGLSGRPELEPLSRWLSAQFAVQAFFTVSGYLIFMSYGRSGPLGQYYERRVRRIIPPPPSWCWRGPHPFLRKIPLAVPLLKNLNSGAREEDNARTAVDFMAASLDFTGYFKILDRAAFLFDPQKSGVSASDINFQNWTVIGAELLTTGTYAQSGDNVEMELRLFDTIKGRQILGKRYSGNVSETRKMILRFCAEVIFYLTGNKGIFNSRIAFVSTASGKKEIYTCDFDGYNPTRLTYNDSISLFPS